MNACSVGDNVYQRCCLPSIATKGGSSRFRVVEFTESLLVHKEYLELRMKASSQVQSRLPISAHRYSDKESATQAQVTVLTSNGLQIVSICKIRVRFRIISSSVVRCLDGSKWGVSDCSPFLSTSRVYICTTLGFVLVYAVPNCGV